MDFRIERRSGVPTYLQIVTQVRQALRLGTLRPGDRLPTAKAVVAQTAVNANTVLKAYRELERDGLVEPRPGLGTFVLRSLARPDSDADVLLRAELEKWMARAAAAGLDREDIDALVTDVRDQQFPRGEHA
ncbi:GntR family transcriptional regulator [Pseudonocardia sp. MH-G8]|uniref:GntR family transcriptional regulator n=1 Tax=Pseudonocardia sp. MH-G8 TaxID=1854588 RepID=UPI000BA13B8D|nr:GntR family transcriptional regulator [Pseudonocardia sp. MH-G8]OZM79370.1 GntR family transcriptional regulator [Pseudonocardia sp. MH-G8]